MKTAHSRSLRFVAGALCAAALVAAFSGCSSNQAPVLPSRIDVVSGDGQYSLKGTVLPEPLIVKLRYADGSAASNFSVRFQVVEGGGSVSSKVVTTNSQGIASTSLTLPDQVVGVKVRASFESNTELYVDFTATSADYYCPEDNPNFVRKFTNAGDLFLVTSKSALFTSGSETVAGIVRIQPEPGEVRVTPFARIDEEQSTIRNVIRDAAFSVGGYFFVAWTGLAYDEVVRIDPDGSYAHFATLESLISEIATTPYGVLVGCDELGPFAVGCRDTLMRFPEASYAGPPNDFVNDNAVAVDPTTQDVYYIHEPDDMLMRLPLDSLVAQGPAEQVAPLTADEAAGARGMVVDDNDGSVFILVDADTVKAIVKVTSAGVKTHAVDFFTRRGSGDAAGIQRDLAIRRGVRFLYTLDTLNDMLLVYVIPTGELTELPPDNQSDPEALSTKSSVGERVGLVVLP